MVASILDFLEIDFWIGSPLFLLGAAFTLWMFIDAVRQRDWIWATFIFFFPFVNAVLYYFFVYRNAPSATRGFELPGTQDRRRIKELQAKIHHLDKAHHHSQLGDIYFQQGKLELAEASYRAAMERDPEDIDTRAHLGQCLLRRKRPAEARPLLEGVIAQNAKHDYGHTMMALAETLIVLGDIDAGFNIWKKITEEHSYPRAKVQLAELYIARRQFDLARAELSEVIHDDAHAPTFERKRARFWIRRAKSLLRKLG
jgi:hypothetical protein